MNQGRMQWEASSRERLTRLRRIHTHTHTNTHTHTHTCTAHAHAHTHARAHLMKCVQDAMGSQQQGEAHSSEVTKKGSQEKRGSKEEVRQLSCELDQLLNAYARQN